MPPISRIAVQPAALAVDRAVHVPDVVARSELNGHSGISVNDVDFHVNENTSESVRQFFSQTLQNINYQSMQHLELCANNFLQHIEAERAINDQTRSALQDPNSPVARQSAHTVHLMRGYWHSLDMPYARRQELVRKLTADHTEDAPADVKEPLHERISQDALSMHAMFMLGQHGPVTFKDSQMGVEAAIGAKEIADHFYEAEPALRELKVFTKQNRVGPTRKGKKQFDAEHGADLSIDLGSKVRGEFNLPVMTGTSGTAADLMNTVKLAGSMQDQPWSAPELQTEQAQYALADTAHHFMREQVVPAKAQVLFDQLRQRLGANVKRVDQIMIFTHSYPEVFDPIEMVLNGEKRHDEAAFRRSAVKVKQRLASALPVKPTALGSLEEPHAGG